MTETSPVVAEYERLSKDAPFNLKDPEAVAALLRAAGNLARENSALLARIAAEAKARGEDPAKALDNPSDTLTRAFEAEHQGLSLIFGLIAGTIETAPEGWGGKGCTEWLASAIPGNLFAAAGGFPEGSLEAAAVNFVSILSNVSSKYAAWEQLLLKFKEPVDPAVFDGMIDVFAKLVAGASKSVALPEAFQRMDFSDAAKEA